MLTNVDTDTAVPAPTPLVMDHSDRCDAGACGAQAFIRAVLPVGDLMFCAHHGREFRERLDKVAILIEDQSESINVKPSVAAF